MQEHEIKFTDDGQLVGFTLAVFYHKEGDTCVAYIPALDLTTHGDDDADVKQAAVESARAFIQELEKMGTTEEVLLELGWR